MLYDYYILFEFEYDEYAKCKLRRSRVMAMT